MKAAAFALSGALAALIFCGALMVNHASDDAQALNEAHEQGREDAAAEQMATVYDRPIAEGNHMPLWLQSDPQWASVPYAGGTVGDAGCGMVCAAMALEYMTLQGITPLQLADYVGDTCLTDGVNDPGKFCRWIYEHYGNDYDIEWRSIYYTLDRALADVEDGWLVFAGMSGTLGDKDYEGHVVLIWRADDDGYWLRDPADASNSARPFSAEELSQVDFKYFYSIRGGFYGNARS